MSSLEKNIAPRLLKKKWQEYLKPVRKEDAEKKLKELLLLLIQYKRDDNTSQSDSELTSIANLLGCEVLKIIHDQCEVLENDIALIQYFQKGLGLYLLQALHVLAPQVNNCNSEVSNVLVSVLPCFLSVPCEVDDDDDAFDLLQKLSMLYNDISSGKKNTESLYNILISSNDLVSSATEITLLQLLALILDIINKLSLKSCSLAVAECYLNVAEKLTTLLLEFARDVSDETGNVDIDDIPQCTWSLLVKLLCSCMLQCTFWKVSVSRGGFNQFSHRIDQSELIQKLLKVLKNMKNCISVDSMCKLYNSNIDGYQLFLTYSVLGMLLTLLKKNVCGETASVSGLDLSRKVYSKEQVASFVKTAPDLLKFLFFSLNEILNRSISVKCCSLVKHQAVVVIVLTGQLVSAVKKAKVSFEAEIQKLNSPLGGEVDNGNIDFKSYTCETWSSSESDTKQPHMVSKHEDHSSQDCAISCLCCTILSVYEESTVEEIDEACLNSLSRCGICHCMTASVVVLPLLSRFVQRTPQVQDMALALLCKMLLKHHKPMRELSSTSQQNSPVFNNVFNPLDTNQPQDDTWLCMEHIFLLATEHGSELSLKVLRHLKVLAKFGSTNLREALLSKVILPFILNYQNKKKENLLSEVCRKLTKNPDDSGYTTPSDRDTSESDGSDTSQTTKPMVSDNALHLSLGALLTLLRTRRLQKIFLNSDGLTKLVNHLGDDSLHSVCLGILQLLASQEDHESIKEKRKLSNDMGKYHEFENRNAKVSKVLLSSMLLDDLTEKNLQKLNPNEVSTHEFTRNIRVILKSARISRLLCQIWRTCLCLLRRNALFRDLFVQVNGPSFIVVVLQVVKESLFNLYKTTLEDNLVKEHAICCITFLEHTVAVGLEFEKHLVDGVQLDIQIHEAVRVIQSLIQKNKLLRRLVGKTFCTTLLNLAVGCANEEHSCLKAENYESEKLLFDFANSDDTESDSDLLDNIECDKMTSAKDVEPGYEADVEQENRSSDVSCKEIYEVRQVKDLGSKRHCGINAGHIRCAEMCSQLINLLEYEGDMTGEDRSLVVYALDGLATLASYSVRNRQILCDQGILLLVLKTFSSCLVCVDVKAKVVQKNIFDLVVLLGGYQFTCEELKIYLKLFNVENAKRTDWTALIKTLRTITSLSFFSRGPTYTHLFPVKTHTDLYENTATKPELQPVKSCNKTLLTSKQRSRDKTARRNSSHSSFEIDSLSSAWLTNTVQLKVNQSLPWPVGSFSIAFWLYLDTGSTGRVDHTSKSPRRRHPTRDTDKSCLKDRGQKSSRFIHVLSFGTKTALFEVWMNAARSALVCRWSNCDSEECGSSVHEDFVKYSLKDYTWYHLVLSVRAGNGDDNGAVTLIIDSSCETTKTLPYPNIPVRKNEQVSLLLGETTNETDVKENCFEKFQPDPFYRLGSLAVFIGDLHRDGNTSSTFMSLLNSSPKNQERLKTIQKDEASFLQLLGPNCMAIDYHLLENTTKCNSNHIDVRILGNVVKHYNQPFLCGPHGEPVLINEQEWDEMKASLKKQLFLVYSPVHFSAFQEYKLEGTDWSGTASHFDYVNTGKAIFSSPSTVARRRRLVESIHNVGGIAVFLYLFAKTVETTSDERTQTDALSIIFTLAKENIVYAKEMEGLLANRMILKVLLTPKCIPGLHFVKVFFTAACEGELFRETGLYDKPYLVNFNTTAVINNYEIVRDFLLSWRIWYKGSSSVVWETVLLALEALTSSTNPNAEFNIQQFERADVLGALLLGCQEIQTENLEFSSTISSQHLNIIQNLLGCSGNPSVLKRICEFLVAVHPPFEIVLIHAPGNLYLSPIAKLKDRETDQEVEINTKISQTVNNDVVLENPVLDEKDSCKEIPRTQTERGETNFESVVSETIVEDGSSENIEIVSRVLNMDDSKEMIISVEHIREKDKEIVDMHLPLPTTEQDPASFEYRTSPPSVNIINEDVDASSKDQLQIPKTSSQGACRHSEPIEITTARKPTGGIAGSYDVVSSSELHARSRSDQTSNSTDDYLVVDSNPGGCSTTMSTYRHYRRTAPEHREQKKLDELRIGLLELIRSALVNLADTAVDHVLDGALKIEYFLCFVNHPAARIRTLSVEIINKILDRGSVDIVNSFSQIYGYHLLAVQIHLHPITQELAEACFTLFFQQPISINLPNFPDTIKAGSEMTKKINTHAVVPLLSMLEGATFCPEIFQFLTKCLVKSLDLVEDFILQATDQGLLVTLVNAVRALAVHKINDSDNGKERHSNCVQIVLDSLQYLVMAIVYRSLRMCGDRYFQIFDDLILFLDRLQNSEPRNKRLTTELVLCSRFLQLCALRFALEYFEYTQSSIKLNRRTFKKALRLSFKGTTNKVDVSDRPCYSSVTYWATLDPSAFPVLWHTSQHTSRPTDATPTEVTNRFQDVCKKAVSFICFSDPLPMVGNGLNLSYSQLTLLPTFEKYKQSDSSFLVHTFETFTQWTFCFLLEILNFCLNETHVCVNKWHELVNQSKDKIRQQLCRLFIHLMAPSQPPKQKYFALQLSRMSGGHEVFLNLVLGAISTKQKERAVAYVRVFLQETGTATTLEEEEVLNTVLEFLKDVEVQKLDKTESDVMSEKQEEWEKQDRSNKIQWESKKDTEQKRLNQELRQLCQRMMSVAMEVTKVSVDVQDKQRQNLLKHVKASLSSEVQSQKLWQTLIKQMTHERAVWYDKVFFPSSWQLDPTEGPCRVRCRLQRCQLGIDEKFVMSEHRKPQSKRPPLSYLFEENNVDSSSKHIYHIFHSTDTIRFLYRCKSIMPAQKIHGEILIGEKRVYFVGEETVAELNNSQFFLDDEDITSVSWLFQEIREILRRRYALQDNALEIFLTNGRTFLLAFETTQDRETVLKELIAKDLPNVITSTENVADLTQRWQNGELTNFAYLTELNKQACRSFNDLMQYPVFPLVLADYTSDLLDLTNRNVYRDLSKPVAVQNPSKVTKFQGRYKDLQEQYDTTKNIDPTASIPPYHYGSHYSNSGVVLHFLVRLVPFTKMFLTYQGDQFDLPDRTFHTLETTWKLSTLSTTSDVKELIPEFFFLPEFLLNLEGFNFGLKQNGERVMDVLLPSWAHHDARFFILAHRQALESDIVSSAISKWIDLIFGFKQEGEAAVEAMNVFHPSTYVGGIDKTRVMDPVHRQAIQTMTDTYGQMPAKLFSEAHPEKRRPTRSVGSPYWSGTFGEELAGSQKSYNERTSLRVQEPTSPLSTVYGIKWGYYVGSPNHPKPVLCWSDSFSPLVAGLVCLPTSHIFLLPAKSTHMIVTRWKNRIVNIAWSAVLTWGHVDNILRIRDFKKGSIPLFLMENINLHKVTCCAVSGECRSLWVGSSTGCLYVWPTRYDRRNECGLEVLGRRVRLQGHQAGITCVKICDEFSVVVTGSDDKTAIIWDLNRLCYIRCLQDHPAPVSFVSISQISGDITTVCHIGNGTISELRLWSVNGRLINKIDCNQRITCVQFSRVPEGVSVNAIAAGLVDGTVRLWNTWTLDHMCDIKDDSCQLPIVWLTYSVTCQHLFTVDSSGTVRAWGANERLSYKPRVIDCVH